MNGDRVEEACPSETTQRMDHRPDVESEPSCLSMESKGEPLEFDSDSERLDPQSSEFSTSQPDQQHQAQLDPIFMVLEKNIITFVKSELKKMQKFLSSDNSECSVLEDEEEKQKSSREALVKITVDFLTRMNQEEMAKSIHNKHFQPECQRKLKSSLKMKFQCMFEGIAEAGNQIFLSQIFTNLYIKEGGTAEVNAEHEIRQIETAARKPHRPEITIRQEDILKLPPGRKEPIRTMMTTGVAGIGKTVLTQKFTLDWADDKANQDIQFTFPLAFRELNVLKERKFSLVQLIHHFFNETKEAGICSFKDLKVIFIFDGLDECKLPLNFKNNQTLTDVTESASVDVLLTNLIKGNLLPSARLWITTRPAAANQIPPECVGMMTEIRGFTDQQKEEYFRRRFKNEEQFTKIISHIKKSRSLHIMCHVPIFCWITATVLEVLLKNSEKGELPRTLTEMYIHFLVVQTKVKMVKYDGDFKTASLWNSESRTMIEFLGKLAFDQLEKGNLIFSESDLKECGIDITAASVHSGLFTQIFKEERGLYPVKMFSFVHLSVQEFLAALHVHLTFRNFRINLMDQEQTPAWFSYYQRPNENNLYQSAVKKALQSPNGHLDLFLRFFLGLSLQTNQSLLQGLLTQTERSSWANQTIASYIKEKISENQSAERTINMFHCLNELNDHSLVKEIQQSLGSGSLSADKLSPAQWSALAFLLVSSDEDLNLFDLQKYSPSEDVLLRLLPVVKASNKVVLNGCNLSERSCEALSSILSSTSCNMKELDLSNNDLQDSGVKELCEGLKSTNCKLESLSLLGCQITEDGCASLASALISNPCQLKKLDLSNNRPGVSGFKLLSAVAEDYHCNLEYLRLNGCDLSEGSCEALSSVLSSTSYSMKELDLSNNDLQDSGVKELCEGLKSSNCKLESLSLSGCLITKEGCTSLVSALISNPSHLRELDLSYNHPEDSGKKLLSAGLENPDWRLGVLRLEPTGERWLRPGGLRKYFCPATIDMNTVNKNLQVSDHNRKVTFTKEDQLHPDHFDRFAVYPQLMCENVLTGRCYWEVEWRGMVTISVSYRDIIRREKRDCGYGYNDQSWSLKCSDFHGHRGYTVQHDDKEIHISSTVSNRVAVYVDCPAGTLSFYRVSSDSVIHLHTFNTTFTKPLYAGFGVWWADSWVSLCQILPDTETGRS